MSTAIQPHRLKWYAWNGTSASGAAAHAGPVRLEVWWYSEAEHLRWNWSAGDPQSEPYVSGFADDRDAAIHAAELAAEGMILDGVEALFGAAARGMVRP